ncbi:MAG TPA: electron transport complex subunit RsxC [bacterium]|nr:electron transport complex subunit RsxC [bacterium]
MRLFPGGIHPDDRKAATAAAAIQAAPLPAVATVFFSQHIGKPARPVVKVGDEVLTGQLLGEPDGFVSAAVHSPVTGKVTALAEVPHPCGEPRLAAVITRAAEEQRAPGRGIDWQTASRDELLAQVRAAGVVGLGGATFPTQVKLSPPADKKIDCLIINAAECEPYLNADARLLTEETAAVIAGIAILRKILGDVRTIIGIEDNKPAAIAALQAAASGVAEVVVVPTRYPQGAEKQLIYALTRRTVPSGKLPMDTGCVVQNAGTAYAVRAAVSDGTPLIERIITVAGGAVNAPGNFRVRIGTPISELFALAGGRECCVRKIIAGGPMMGLALTGMEFSTGKGTSGLLFLTEDEAREPRQYPCIRCGRCGEVCPMGLSSRALELATDTKELELL